MAALPKTHEGLDAAGYRFSGEGTCRGCDARILWYKTPKDRPIPLDPETFEPHWGSCPQAAEFRKDKRK